MPQATVTAGRLATRPGFGRALNGPLRERLVQPLIVYAGEDERHAIPSIPGQYYLSLTEAVREARLATRAGIAGVLLFAAPDRRDESAFIAAERDWLVPRAVRAIKDAVPELGVATDVCVCAYTAHGQCVLFRGGDADVPGTHERLATIAIAHAEAGADIVVLSGMLEGSVRAVRQTLSETGSEQVAVAGAVKYGSALYAAYDGAVGIRPYRERAVPLLDAEDAPGALVRAEAQAAAGADLLVVMPGALALDVCVAIRQRVSLPIASFQAAGEYALARSSFEYGVLDGPAVLLETARAARRAGADLIFSYASLETAEALEAQVAIA